MDDPIKQLGKIVPKETVGRFYDDAISRPAKELGKLGTDAAKVARLLLAPLQVGALLQDRFEHMIERIRARVPEDNLTDAPAELVAPALEKMRYITDECELWKMYEEALTRAVDKKQADNIHPSFVHIISQLSRDEAWMLYWLRERSFKVVDKLDLIDGRFENRMIEHSEVPSSELTLPDQIELYYSHLSSLTLVEWPVLKQEPIKTNGKQTGVRRHSIMQLTQFGRLFSSSCIPPDGFTTLSTQ